MPDLSSHIVEQLKKTLINFVPPNKGYGDPKFIKAGGSAAVFKVEGPEGVRAFKIFDPQFISSESGSADKKRLELQRQLIGHECVNLVQMYRVEEFENTAIIEMDFVAFPQLTEMLASVPRDKIIPLISQLVSAVMFLESKGMVHRDIKPDNIHVSENYEKLVLLDLGVIRKFDNDVSGADTDNGNVRPFLATAQYSSPEYLFRLDAPSENLWRGLNFYQIGAVLHDLINLRPIFEDEIKCGNRWILAKAVLFKKPKFSVGETSELQKLQHLSSLCLTKNLEDRLSLVKWDDFNFKTTFNPIEILKKSILSVKNGENNNPFLSKILSERNLYKKRILDGVRNKIIPLCKTDMPLNAHPHGANGYDAIRLVFSPASKPHKIECLIRFDWKTENPQVAIIDLGTRFIDDSNDDGLSFSATSKRLIESEINNSEDFVIQVLVDSLIVELGSALQIWSLANDSGIDELNEYLSQSNNLSKE